MVVIEEMKMMIIVQADVMVLVGVAAEVQFILTGRCLQLQVLFPAVSQE